MSILVLGKSDAIKTYFNEDILIYENKLSNVSALSNIIESCDIIYVNNDYVINDYVINEQNNKQNTSLYLIKQYMNQKAVLIYHTEILGGYNKSSILDTELHQNYMSLKNGNNISIISKTNYNEFITQTLTGKDIEIKTLINSFMKEIIGLRMLVYHNTNRIELDILPDLEALPNIYYDYNEINDYNEIISDEEIHKIKSSNIIVISDNWPTKFVDSDKDNTSSSNEKNGKFGKAKNLEDDDIDIVVVQRIINNMNENAIFILCTNLFEKNGRDQFVSYCMENNIVRYELVSSSGGGKPSVFILSKNNLPLGKTLGNPNYFAIDFIKEYIKMKLKEHQITSNSQPNDMTHRTKILMGLGIMFMALLFLFALWLWRRKIYSFFKSFRRKS